MDGKKELLVIGEANELFDAIGDNFGDTYSISLVAPEKATAEYKEEHGMAIVIQSQASSPLETISALLEGNPQAALIYVHGSQDFQLLRDAVRLGVADYLVLPDEMKLLQDRVHELMAKKAALSQNGAPSGFKRGTGQIFAFYSGKGGAGKTFLSTAFAQTLKLESTAQVLHIDLNLHYGGAETFLGVESERSIVDLKPVITEINENHIRNITENEQSSKLELLLSPRDAELAENIDSDFVTRLLRACRRSYDFIIVDLPSTIDETIFSALEEADRIYYAITLDTPSIRVLKHTEELFQRLGLPTENRLEFVINEKGRENELNKKDLERFVQYPVAAEVRRDMKGVQAAVNKGVPIRTEPKEKKMIPAAKDVHKWVHSMLK